MLRIAILLVILLLGAVALGPVIAALGPDPVPGDIALNWGGIHRVFPVTYSLCASLGLALLYWFLKR